MVGRTAAAPSWTNAFWRLCTRCPCLAATVRLASSDLDAGNAGRHPGTANGGSHSSGHDEPSAGAGPGSPGAAPADGALPLVASGESQPAGGHRSVAGVVAASAPGGV